MIKNGKFLGVLATAIIISTMFYGTAFADEKDEDISSKTICNGVYIEGIDMGGKTGAEAKQLLTDYIAGVKNTKIIINANEKSIDTTLGDVGYEANSQEYVNEAVNIGTVGNVIQRYKDLKDVEHGKKEYDIEFSYDETLVDTFVNDNIEEINVKAKEPAMTPKSTNRISSSDIASQFNYSEGITGMVVKGEDVISKVKSSIDGWTEGDIIVEAEVEVDKPKYTIEQLKTMDAKIGTFTTSFSTNQTGRCKNIANAASKINCTVVYPGETFSTLKKITPINESNGYYEAGSYLAGKVVESVGGGVCQVSTTLYNAVLASELEIVKRNNHSMVVAYVDIAFDAMIASSSGSDFKFKNNTNYPIYIEGYVSGGSITFNVYGKETRASNRSVKFVNEITESIQPGADIVTVDPTKDASYYKVTQSAHVGYKAMLYKIVTVDGTETERVLVNKSTYKAVPKYVTVGSAQTTVAPEATADPNSDINQDDIPIIVDPVVTVAPVVETPIETPVEPTVAAIVQ